MSHQYSPLFQAVVDNDVPALRQAIATGGDVNEKVVINRFEGEYPTIEFPVQMAAASGHNGAFCCIRRSCDLR